MRGCVLGCPSLCRRATWTFLARAKGKTTKGRWERWVKAVWDKELCSHECHTNKAQSDIEVQPLR